MGWYLLQKYIVMGIMMFFVGTHLTSRNAKWIFPSKKALHHSRNFSPISSGMSLNDFKKSSKGKIVFPGMMDLKPLQSMTYKQQKSR